LQPAYIITAFPLAGFPEPEGVTLLGRKDMEIIRAQLFGQKIVGVD
jgi:hypothetical protein